MNAICGLFLLSSQLRLSSVSVTFDFNGPLNDVAPLIPKMFAVDLMTIKKKKECLLVLLYVFFCIYHSD